MRFCVLLLASVPVAVFAQPFSFGIKVGAPFTDSFNVSAGQATFTADTKRFIVGPTAEIRLPLGFGIEADALYRRYEYSYGSGTFVPGVGGVLNSNTKAGSWEFPIMAKIRGGLPLIKPYAVGGISFKHLMGIKQTVSCLGGTCGQSFNDIAHDSNVGLVLGAGLQVNVLLLKISPEIRFTRWGVANFESPSSVNGRLKFNQNQADILIGFTF